jgi:hypothetical protein
MRVRVENGRLVEVAGQILCSGMTAELTIDQAVPLLRSGAVRRQRASAPAVE